MGFRQWRNGDGNLIQDFVITPKQNVNVNDLYKYATYEAILKKEEVLAADKKKSD